MYTLVNDLFKDGILRSTVNTKPIHVQKIVKSIGCKMAISTYHGNNAFSYELDPAVLI